MIIEFGKLTPRSLVKMISKQLKQYNSSDLPPAVRQLLRVYRDAIRVHYDSNAILIYFVQMLRDAMRIKEKPSDTVIVKLLVDSGADIRANNDSLLKEFIRINTPKSQILPTIAQLYFDSVNSVKGFGLGLDTFYDTLQFILDTYEATSGRGWGGDLITENMTPIITEAVRAIFLNFSAREVLQFLAGNISTIKSYVFPKLVEGCIKNGADIRADDHLLLKAAIRLEKDSLLPIIAMWYMRNPHVESATTTCSNIFKSVYPEGVPFNRLSTFVLECASNVLTLEYSVLFSRVRCLQCTHCFQKDERVNMFVDKFAHLLIKRLAEMWVMNGKNSLMYMYLLWRMVARPDTYLDAALQAALNTLAKSPFVVAQIRYFWEMGAVVQTYTSFKNEHLRYYAVPAWSSGSASDDSGSAPEQSVKQNQIGSQQDKKRKRNESEPLNTFQRGVKRRRIKPTIKPTLIDTIPQEWRAIVDASDFNLDTYSEAVLKKSIQRYNELPKHLRRAVKKYQANSFQINQGQLEAKDRAEGFEWNERGISKEKTLAYIKAMHDIFDALPPTKMPLFAYRGMSLDKIEDMRLNEKHFVSVSTNLSVSRDFQGHYNCCLLHVIIPPGSKVIVPKSRHEQELILPPGGTWEQLGQDSDFIYTFAYIPNLELRTVTPSTIKQMAQYLYNKEFEAMLRGESDIIQEKQSDYFAKLAQASMFRPLPSSK